MENVEVMYKDMGGYLWPFFSPAPPLHDVKGVLSPNLEMYTFFLVLNARSTGFLIKSLLKGWRAGKTDSQKTNISANVGKIIFIQKCESWCIWMDNV